MTAATTECIDCGEPVDADGAYTDPLGRSGGICGPCIEHLDPKTWTKKTILGHLFAGDRSYYYTSGITKADMIRDHQNHHKHASERRANLLRRADTIAYLRETFGCRLDDSGFDHDDDEWIANHVRRHQAGETGPTLL